jgi:3-hydroxy-9,10-secoandrosta-1,3,5(10)-triene-9,17-dione monooxygenase
MSVIDHAELATTAEQWSLDDVTPETIVARARAVAPTLVAQQAENEARTYYSQETHELFQRAGFYRILTPRRYGGFEFGVDTFFRVVMELTAGCSSTGWQYSLGHSHTLTVASLFEEALQDEVFADPDFICPCTGRPQGAATARPDGDWQLSGVFNYCSGAPYGGYFLGHALLADGPKSPNIFLAPRSEWTMLNDWGAQLGCKGTGSHSIKFDDAIIPGRYVLPDTSIMHMDVSAGTVGSRLHGNPMYAGTPQSFFLINLAAIATGMAKNAMAAFEELMGKTTAFPPIVPRTEDPGYQRCYGLGAGKVLTAESLTVAAAHKWLEVAEQGATREADMAVVLHGRETFDLCWSAVSEIFRMAGSSAVLDGSRMQRAWRDMSTLRSHSGVVYFTDLAATELTKAHFGIS